MEEGYQAYGGIFREECVMLLRRFYVQDNDKVPEVKVSFSILLFVFWGWCGMVANLIFSSRRGRRRGS